MKGARISIEGRKGEFILPSNQQEIAEVLRPFTLPGNLLDYFAGLDPVERRFYHIGNLGRTTTGQIVALESHEGPVVTTHTLTASNQRDPNAEPSRITARSVKAPSGSGDWAPERSVGLDFFCEPASLILRPARPQRGVEAAPDTWELFSLRSNYGYVPESACDGGVKGTKHEKELTIVRLAGADPLGELDELLEGLGNIDGQSTERGTQRVYRPPASAGYGRMTYIE